MYARVSRFFLHRHCLWRITFDQKRPWPCRPVRKKASEIAVAPPQVQLDGIASSWSTAKDLRLVQSFCALEKLAVVNRLQTLCRLCLRTYFLRYLWLNRAGPSRSSAEVTNSRCRGLGTQPDLPRQNFSRLPSKILPQNASKSGHNV